MDKSSRSINRVAPRTRQIKTDDRNNGISRGKCSETLSFSNYSIKKSEIGRNQKIKSKSYWYSSYEEAPGLENIGNTCYLNSALQCLHKTIPFQQNFKRHLGKILHNGIKPLSSEY